MVNTPVTTIFSVYTISSLNLMPTLFKINEPLNKSGLLIYFDSSFMIVSYVKLVMDYMGLVVV